MKARYYSLSPRKSWFGLSALLIVGLFFPEGAPAQPKTERVAILKSADIAPYNQAIEAFRNNLPIKRSLIHEYNLKGELENGPDIVQNILDSKVDLVLAVGLKASLVAKIEIRDGAHCGAVVYARSNRMPCLANFSRFGVISNFVVLGSS